MGRKVFLQYEFMLTIFSISGWKLIDFKCLPIFPPRVWLGLGLNNKPATGVVTLEKSTLLAGRGSGLTNNNMPQKCSSRRAEKDAVSKKFYLFRKLVKNAK